MARTLDSHYPRVLVSCCDDLVGFCWLGLPVTTLDSFWISNRFSRTKRCANKLLKMSTSANKILYTKRPNELVEIMAEATVELVAHLHLTTIASVTTLGIFKEGSWNFCLAELQYTKFVLSLPYYEGQSGLDKLLNVAAFGLAR
jgi:hypothetical protein